MGEPSELRRFGIQSGQFKQRSTQQREQRFPILDPIGSKRFVTLNLDKEAHHIPFQLRAKRFPKKY
jgi:hypothetical protein